MWCCFRATFELFVEWTSDRMTCIMVVRLPMYHEKRDPARLVMTKCEAFTRSTLCPYDTARLLVHTESYVKRRIYDPCNAANSTKHLAIRLPLLILADLLPALDILQRLDYPRISRNRHQRLLQIFLRRLVILEL